MAGAAWRIQQGDPAGGSLALAQLLDEYAEEVYLDLLEHRQFDLVAYLSGEVTASLATVQALIRSLPEGSRFFAAMSAAGEQQEDTEREPLDPELETALERRYWTRDRQLQAALINAVNEQTRLLGHWRENKEPKFPKVGPPWWEDGKARGGAQPDESDPLKKFFMDMGF